MVAGDDGRSDRACSELDRGREAYAARAWAEAYGALRSAAASRSLGPADLERLAVSALLTGDEAGGEEAWAQAYQGFLDAGEPAAAARCAIWLGMHLGSNGEPARAGGWLARAGRLLDEAGLDCVERGYLLIPVGIRALQEGRAADGRRVFDQAAAIAERFGDTQLSNMARHGRGRSLLKLGDLDGGMALLDEGMLAVTAGEVSPLVAGNLYCSMIDACSEVLDLRRAHEWTGVLTRWCEAQPELVPQRGICLVHRSRILQMHGQWPDAIEAAQEACERLSQVMNHFVTGSAFYQRGELCRLRGDEQAAEEAFREASRWGRDPQPGLALLRSAQGRIEQAAAAVRRLLADTAAPLARAAILPACVEVLLAAGDPRGASAAAEELSGIAAKSGNPLVEAMAAQSSGAVLIASGQAGTATAVLRRAVALWHEVGSPFEAARTRALLGQACRVLGDEETAQMEFDAAREVLESLAAAPELARLNALAAPAKMAAGGLTGRELEVLRLVATGMKNRAIASELVISEKTVARHVSNIFTKLSLSSRAEATAHAHRHHLV